MHGAHVTPHESLTATRDFFRFAGLRFYHRTMKRPLPLFLALTFTAAIFAAEPDIDWQRAKDLFQRSQAGEKLSADEQTYLDNAKARRAKGGQPSSPGAGAFDWDAAKRAHAKHGRGEALTADEQTLLDEATQRMKDGRGPGADGRPANAPQSPPKDLAPLTELTGKYKDQDGGLYGGEKNEPPAAHAALAAKAIAQIRPLNRDGKPAADGKIVLLSIGMSNTTQEFSTFVPKANASPLKAPGVVVVDGAQGGKDATAWATADAEPWRVAEQRLTTAVVSPAQVEAVWIKQALMGPQKGFPAETERLRDRLREIVTLAKTKFPNLRVAYLSSRIYAGYARSTLNPEPYAFESAFAVRWLIEEQMKGSPALNADATKGEVKAPVLLWGPYLWANGETPRKTDGLSYSPGDFGGDGTHPGTPAREKVAGLLLDFFTTHPLAKPWFTK